MKKRLVALALLPIVLVLAGCTAPLTNKLVSTTVTVSAPRDSLIGDPVKVTAAAGLKRGRTDEISLKIQVSANGSNWSTVKTSNGPGPKLYASYSFTTKTAATVKYRAIVTATAKSEKPLDASSTESLTTSDIKEMIRKFYYDRTTAYGTSAAAGAAWDAANDSSVYNQKAATWVSNIATSVADADIETTVPDLTTVSPDPTWRLVGSSCNAAMTLPPPGRTFIVTVDFGGSFDGIPVAQSKSDVHVTLDDGKLVDYTQGCAN